MNFENMRINEIHGVIRFNSVNDQWVAKNRKNHIIGIQSRGKAVHTFKNSVFTISENCIYFMNQKDDYSVKVIEPCEAFSIHFTTYEDIDCNSFCIPIVNNTNILSILQKAEMANFTDKNLSLISLTYQLCAEIERIRTKKYLPKDTRILIAKEYFDLHFKEPGCLKSAVEKSGISARRFGELFRNTYDTTPNQYVTSRKIEYAKSLLSAGCHTVTEISALCNFSDVCYFTKVFKNETGISPAKWKYNLNI